MKLQNTMTTSLQSRQLQKAGASYVPLSGIKFKDSRDDVHSAPMSSPIDILANYSLVLALGTMKVPKKDFSLESTSKVLIGSIRTVGGKGRGKLFAA